MKSIFLMLAVAFATSGCAVPRVENAADLNQSLAYLPWDCIDPASEDGKLPCFNNSSLDWPVVMQLQAQSPDLRFALQVSGLIKSDAGPTVLPFSWRWIVPIESEVGAEASQLDLFALHALIVSGLLGDAACRTEDHCEAYAEQIRDAASRKALVQSFARSARLVVNRPQTQEGVCREKCIGSDAHAAACNASAECQTNKPAHPFHPRYAIVGVCSPARLDPNLGAVNATYARALEFTLPATAGGSPTTVRALIQRNAHFVRREKLVDDPAQDIRKEQPSVGSVSSVLLEPQIPVHVDSETNVSWIPVCTTAASLEQQFRKQALAVTAVDRQCASLEKPAESGSPYLRLTESGDDYEPNRSAETYRRIYSENCEKPKGKRYIRFGLRDRKGRLPASTDLEIGAVAQTRDDALGEWLLAPGDRVRLSSN